MWSRSGENIGRCWDASHHNHKGMRHVRAANPRWVLYLQSVVREHGKACAWGIAGDVRPPWQVGSVS